MHRDMMTPAEKRVEDLERVNRKLVDACKHAQQTIAALAGTPAFDPHWKEAWDILDAAIAESEKENPA
jgi:hypothetical protein